MYAGEDGEVCVELGHVGKALSVSKASQPDKSKAGGWPAWFGEAPVKVGDLVCGLCGRWLYLVTQIYAPTHVERSLCLFGCNRAACSLRSEGWRAVRTQAPQPVEPAQDDSDPTAVPAVSAVAGTTNVAPPTPPTSTQPAAHSTDPWGASGVSWDAPASDGDGWGAETTDWGAGVDTEGVGGIATADIDALLDKQEKKQSSTCQGDRASAAAAAAAAEKRLSTGGDTCSSLSELAPNHSSSGSGSQQKSAAESSKSDTVAAEGGDWGGRPCFPAKTVSFVPEPWGAETSRTDDKDMENRLRRYREQEEDRGLVAALDHALGLKDAGGLSSEHGGKEGKGVASVGEKYERTPARAKAVMRFADRVARSPQQVVRYAYGGGPLWSASDPPREEIPPCACGATRVFEMQLMPALLLQLQVNDLAEREIGSREGGSPATFSGLESKKISTLSQEAGGHDNNNTLKSRTPSAVAVQPKGAASTRSTDEHGVAQGDGSGVMAGIGVSGEEDEGNETTMMPTPSVEERERLRTLGMDWGVVAIWSCPRSCSISCEECVVVQLPV
ncbi:unnamed protein product [Ectocarpus sp. 8 AP-2014]